MLLIGMINCRSSKSHNPKLLGGSAAAHEISWVTVAEALASIMPRLFWVKYPFVAKNANFGFDVLVNWLSIVHFFNLTYKVTMTCPKWLWQAFLTLSLDIQRNSASPGPGLTDSSQGWGCRDLVGLLSQTFGPVCVCVSMEKQWEQEAEQAQRWMDR